MSLPLIGLTTSRVNNSKGFPHLMVMEAYSHAVSQAGAAPIMIPLGVPPETLQAILGRLDGVLFTGGGDIRPLVYGSQDHHKVCEIDDDRDQLELDLFRLLMAAGKPFLGICRGIQLINVALGGTLYEDILDQRPGVLKHDQSRNARNYLAHAVELTEASQLSCILGASQVKVNSLHHQGIRELAPGLKVSAYAPDGLVEAFEIPGYSFGMAVQWHPEWLQEHPPMRNLFQAFVQAAAGQCSARPNHG
jgi:putative glutamine amidotransferase